MSEWKHCTAFPSRVGIYEVRYHEDWAEVGEGDQGNLFHELYWSGFHWHTLAGDVPGPRSAFGNHGRADIRDCWRELT